MMCHYSQIRTDRHTGWNGVAFTLAVHARAGNLSPGHLWQADAFSLLNIATFFSICLSSSENHYRSENHQSISCQRSALLGISPKRTASTTWTMLSTKLHACHKPKLISFLGLWEISLKAICNLNLWAVPLGLNHKHLMVYLINHSSNYNIKHTATKVVANYFELPST